MKSRAHNLFLMVLVGLFFSLFVQRVSAKDIILNLAFVDRVAIEQTDINAIIDDLQKKYPESEIITLTAPAKRRGYLTNSGRLAARKKLYDKVNALSLNPDDKISMIIISTHGHSSAKNNETSLDLIGKISATSGPDKDLKNFFNPILPYIADDTKVILSSCSTLCGTDKSSAARSIKFLNFLGAHNGSIFGATSPLAFNTKTSLMSRKMIVMYLAGGFTLMEGHFFYNVIAGNNLFSDVHTPEGIAIKLLTNWAIGTGVLLMARALNMPSLTNLASRIKLINAGKILNLREGDVSKVQATSFFFNKDEIFSKTLSCHNLFAG